MALTDTKEMFRKAYEGHYAIGAFNVNNMEIIQGIMEAAHEEQSAVILQASEGARNYAGSPYIVDLVKTAVRQYPEIPVALPLDHGSCLHRSCLMVPSIHLKKMCALPSRLLNMRMPMGWW